MSLIRRLPRFHSRRQTSGRRWRGLAIGAVGAIAFALTGCSSGSGSSGSGSASHGSANGTTTSVSVPPFNLAHNAHADVTQGQCTGNRSAGWVLHGTARNSATTARTYSIAVDFVTNPGGTVMATQVVNVGPVASHKTESWSTPPAGQGHAHLSCVIRQSMWS
jgi:hypothetical protein